MKVRTPFLIAPLTGYVLNISALVASCLLSGKCVAWAGMVGCCSMLFVPITVFCTYLLVYAYGVLEKWQMAIEGFMVCVIVGCTVWAVGCIPLDSNSVVEANIWQEVMGKVPRLALWQGVCYVVMVLTVGCFFNTTQARGIKKELIIILLGVVTMSVLQAIGMHSMAVANLQWIGTLFWVAVSMLLLMGLGLKIFIKREVIFPYMRGYTRPNDNAKWLKAEKRHPLSNPVYRRCLAFFLVLLLLTNVVSVRYFTLGGYLLTAGLLTYPFTFVVTDVVGELYGKQHAKHVVWGGFAGSIFMMIAVWLVSALPMYETCSMHQASFLHVFGFMPGMVLASMAAYLLGQFTDIYLFERLRELTRGKHLWLRNNVGTIVSELLDTVVFSVGVWVIWPLLDPVSGSVPLSWQVCYSLMVNEYRGKVVMALLDTPLVYGLVWVLRKRKVKNEK